MAYESTDVPVDRSQASIRKLLQAQGARSFAFSETEMADRQWASVEFVHDGQRVRLRVPLKPLERDAVDRLASRKHRSRAQLEHEVMDQEARRVWRVLFHGLKARLVSVEEGMETFEEAFLAHLVDPVTGATTWETVKGAVQAGALRDGGAGLWGTPALPAGPTSGL